MKAGSKTSSLINREAKSEVIRVEKKVVINEFPNSTKSEKKNFFEESTTKKNRKLSEAKDKKSSIFKSKTHNNEKKFKLSMRSQSPVRSTKQMVRVKK